MLFDHWPYLLIVALLAIGLYGVLSKHNLMKKVIGLNIFQSSIILFFISGAARWNATVPVLEPGSGIAPSYPDPLPHVLMLTAIVVMVATLGVGLSILILIYRRYHTLDESEILQRMSRE